MLISASLLLLFEEGERELPKKVTCVATRVLRHSPQSRWVFLTGVGRGGEKGGLLCVPSGCPWRAPIRREKCGGGERFRETGSCGEMGWGWGVGGYPGAQGKVNGRGAGPMRWLGARSRVLGLFQMPPSE